MPLPSWVQTLGRAYAMRQERDLEEQKAKAEIENSSFQRKLAEAKAIDEGVLPGTGGGEKPLPGLAVPGMGKPGPIPNATPGMGKPQLLDWLKDPVAAARGTLYETFGATPPQMPENQGLDTSGLPPKLQRDIKAKQLEGQIGLGNKKEFEDYQHGHRVERDEAGRVFTTGRDAQKNTWNEQFQGRALKHQDEVQARNHAFTGGQNALGRASADARAAANRELQQSLANQGKLFATVKGILGTGADFYRDSLKAGRTDAARQATAAAKDEATSFNEQAKEGASIIDGYGKAANDARANFPMAQSAVDSKLATEEEVTGFYNSVKENQMIYQGLSTAFPGNDGKALVAMAWSPDDTPQSNRASMTVIQRMVRSGVPEDACIAVAKAMIKRRPSLEAVLNPKTSGGAGW